MKSFQSNIFNLIMQTKQTAQNAFETANIKETTDECQGKKGFCIYFFGVKQG